MPPTLEISVPRTSTSSTNSSKPYTLYHITLTLPLRTHNISKRYTDFTALHTALVSQTGAPPPAPLPAKSWLKTTVSNPQLAEERRAQLETYLKTILESEDGRWRQASAWRAFLDLPKGLQSSDYGSSNGKPAASEMLDANEWLDVHREVKSQIHNARMLLKKREGAATAQEQHATSAEAKAALVRAGTGIVRCEDSLKGMGAGQKGKDDGGWGAARLGDGEIRRRRDLLGASRKEVESLETVMRSLVVKSNGAGAGSAGPGASAAATEGDKAALWNGTGAAHKSGRVLGGPLKETDRTRELGNDGVLQLQKQIMQEQDEDVLEIGKAVSRMKEMGIMINEELVVQNQMLGLLEQDVDRVDSKIAVAKKKIGKIH